MVLEGVRGKQNLVSVGVLYVGQCAEWFGFGASDLWTEAAGFCRRCVSAGELFKKSSQNSSVPCSSLGAGVWLCHAIQSFGAIARAVADSYIRP